MSRFSERFFFSLLNSLNLVERLVTSRYLFCVYDYVYLFCLCFSAVALSLNFTHHDVFFFVQYCLFTINSNYMLIKSNIFLNLSKLRNYTSLIKINFRQIILQIKRFRCVLFIIIDVCRPKHTYCESIIFDCTHLTCVIIPSQFKYYH